MEEGRELQAFVSGAFGIAAGPETPSAVLDSIQQVELHEFIRLRWGVNMDGFRLRDLPTLAAVADWVAARRRA